MMEHVITFRDDGTVGAIYADELLQFFKALGSSVTRRASDVEPTEHGWMVKIRGWVEPGKKCMRIGPFPTRAEALEAELAWLRRVL